MERAIGIIYGKNSDEIAAGFAAIMLFLSNSVINIAVPSCSGQAAIVLPVMMPIGKLLHIPDQVVVSAFIYGDGLTNLCIPTFAALMGALTIAKVPFGKWLRFMEAAKWDVMGI